LRGWRAVSRGLIAVGTGNLRIAERSAKEARKLLAGEPLALLLSAQAAQLGGHSAAAEGDFRQMLAHDETKLLGLHGLFVEARRRGDPAAALAFAEEAARRDPALAWAGEAVIEFRCRAGDWAGALEALDRQIHAKAISKTAGRRRRAVLLTAQALALEDTDAERARTAATEAARLARDLVPAIAAAARLEARAGNLRRARRMLEKAFVERSHPELAEAYAELKPEETARERLARMKRLAQKMPGNAEALMAVARAAIDANDFALARNMIAPLTKDPTQRVCLIAAEIESAEHGDHGKAREWTARAVRARRDPAWVADGYVAEHWLPISPISGRLDAFVWMVPQQQQAAPVLEQVTRQALAEAATPPSPPPPSAPAKIEHAPQPPSGEARRLPRRKAEPIVAEPPLPDDPGPEPQSGSSSRGRLFP
jgi:HemY protein